RTSARAASSGSAGRASRTCRWRRPSRSASSRATRAPPGSGSSTTSRTRWRRGCASARGSATRRVTPTWAGWRAGPTQRWIFDMRRTLYLLATLVPLALIAPRAALADPVVLSVDGDHVVVGLGAADGVGAGTQLELRREIVAVDPATRERLRDTFPLGTLS